MPDEQRTEQATPRRKEKAREQGDYVHSRELMAAMALMAGVVAMGPAGKSFAGLWGDVYGACVQMAVASARDGMSPDAMVHALRKLLQPMALPVGLVLAAAALGALISGVAQSGGVRFTPQALAFKPERLNPVTNLGNLFSMRTAARMGKSLAPAAIVAVFGWQALRAVMEPMPMLSTARLPMMIAASYGLMRSAAWVMLGWAALDYAVEWFSYGQRLRMSKQEMREEMKEQMGNPQVRGRIRSLQRAMRQRKRRADVSKASVVITNPTHYAVALKFDFSTMQAPMVLDKGRNLFAEQIKQEARWAGVPIVENPPLARSLYKSVEPGQAIPAELYAAVAAILAYLYRQQVEDELRRQKMREAVARAARRDAASPQRQKKNSGPLPPGNNKRGNNDRPRRDSGTQQGDEGRA